MDNSIMLANEFYYDAIGLMPSNEEYFTRTAFTIDWLLDQSYPESDFPSRRYDGESLKLMLHYVRRHEAECLTIESLPDIFWSAGEVTVKSRDKKYRRNLIDRNVFYYNKELTTTIGGSLPEDCPKFFVEPKIMFTTKDLLALMQCDNHVATDEQIVTRIEDIGKFNHTQANNLDLAITLVNIITEQHGKCPWHLFMSNNYIEEARYRLENLIRIKHRLNQEHYILRQELLHVGD